ncbi:MAG: DUF58 domain-containing protein [Candidatus Bathyarchaeia archaeon]
MLVGAIFFNPVILTFTSLLLLFLCIEGIAFHRSASVAKVCLTVKSDRQTITCTIGRPTETQDVISNSSNQDFRIAGLFLPRHAQSTDQSLSSEEFLLKKHEKHKLRARFECEVPGRFDIQALKVMLTSRTNLFAHTVWVHCKTTLIIRPAINLSKLASIDSSFFYDLTSDNIRRGAGSDLAGVRPSTVMENLHRVDWKATARRGTLIIKEFFPDKQPAIVLVIDASRTMKATRNGKSIFGQFLATLPNLLASIKQATPIGLILYNENSIITNMSPQVGEHQRDLVLDTLLNCTGPGPTSRSNSLALKTASPKATTGTTSIERYQYQKIFNPILARLHWFYTDVRLRHRERMHQQGAFIALSHMGNRSDSCLIIAVTDGTTNLNGLIEGTRAATISGNRVILVLLTPYGKISTSHIFPELQDTGVKIQECLPEELPRLIEAEIARMSRERFVPHGLERVQAQSAQ